MISITNEFQTINLIWLGGIWAIWQHCGAPPRQLRRRTGDRMSPGGGGIDAAAESSWVRWHRTSFAFLLFIYSSFSYRLSAGGASGGGFLKQLTNGNWADDQQNRQLRPFPQKTLAAIL